MKTFNGFSGCVFMFQLFAAGAPISYTFNVVLPPKESTISLRKSMFIMIGLPMITLGALCFLYTNMLKG